MQNIRYFMRTKKTYFLTLSLCICFIAFAKPRAALLPVNLTVEYLTNPLGLDEAAPRFSWNFKTTDSIAYGQKQTAYRILVSTSADGLEKNIGNAWDSKWVHSPLMQLIEYKGIALVSDRTYYWKVQVKDEKGKITTGNTAFWSTGLFHQYDWTAKWIGSSQLFNPKLRDCNIDDPWLRKTFELATLPSKAMLFVASVGYHEVYINGEKISDGILNGAVTDHTKRARYIAYNIAGKLKTGKNTIALWLGSSWSVFAPYATKDKPRTPLVIAQADLYDTKMSIIKRIETDASWKIHASPNRLLGTWEMQNYGGEIWDANKDIPDWNLPGYNDTKWMHAKVYRPQLVISSQNVEINKKFHEINPVSIEAGKDGYRVDMGVNFTGWTRINVSGQPGDTIRFLFSEREKDEMTFKLHSIYIIGPSGKGTFENRFNYSAARWIMIKGLKSKPEPGDIKGWVVRTDYKKISSFKSSDSLQNWIYDRICWNYENLSIGGYVVDCSQRERFGYGGDAHATSETGMYNYRLGAFYTKWMQDWRDVQGTETTVGNMNDTNWAHRKTGSGRYLNNGVLPHTAPTYHGGGGPAWGGIVISLPWYLYQHEGDTRILSRNYELIKGWLGFLATHTKSGLLQRYGGQWDFLGDWLWPNATAEGMNNNKPENLCFNNCYYVYNLRTAAKIASVLGNNNDADEWVQQADATASAIHEMFYNAGDHSYADSSMSNLAAALLASIPPADQYPLVMKRLEEEILIHKKGHIHAGITGGTLLFKLLRDEGLDSLMYSMTSQTTYPGWGYMKANGATSIWEMWEKDLPGHSLLHSSYLFPGAWYIEGLGSIKPDPEKPGFQHFIITVPNIPENKLSAAQTSFDSPAGLIKTSWKKQNGSLALNVTVPPNCTGTVYLPATKNKIHQPKGKCVKLKEENGLFVYKIYSGTYEFKIN